MYQDEFTTDPTMTFRFEFNCNTPRPKFTILVLVVLGRLDPVWRYSTPVLSVTPCTRDTQVNIGDMQTMMAAEDEYVQTGVS